MWRWAGAVTRAATGIGLPASSHNPGRQRPHPPGRHARHIGHQLNFSEMSRFLEASCPRIPYTRQKSRLPVEAGLLPEAQFVEAPVGLRGGRVKSPIRVEVDRACPRQHIPAVATAASQVAVVTAQRGRQRPPICRITGAHRNYTSKRLLSCWRQTHVQAALQERIRGSCRAGGFIAVASRLSKFLPNLYSRLL